MHILQLELDLYMLLRKYYANCTASLNECSVFAYTFTFFFSFWV